MKILAPLVFAICLAPLLSGEDKTQPPVLITKVEPDYRNVATGYVVESAELEMTLDAAGVPFALKSSVALPDNVVQAVSQWRYRPYKDKGRAVPCAFNLTLAFRRQITPVLESSILPRWSPLEDQVRHAVEDGNQLTAEKALELEQNLPQAEALAHARTSLLVYYAKGLPDVSTARQARARVIAWLVQNYPDDDILGSPAAIVNASAEPLADAEAQTRIQQLWLQALQTSANNPAIAQHAVNLLRITDPGKAIQILSGLRAWPESNVWLGNVYALRALAVTALDPRGGNPVAVDETAARQTFAASAQSALLNATNAKAVLSAMATVESAHAALSKLNLWTPEAQNFCQRLLDHTRQIYPAASASCDVDHNPPIDTVALIHSTQRNASAKLKKRVAPPYPAEAKQQRIQGTLEFSAIINASGRIEQLGFLSGPLIFYASTQHAVSQWEYEPTTVNGHPVAVETKITVNFDLR